MPRASKVKRLPPEQRRFVEKLLREDRLSLSEMIAEIRREYPDADVSRTGLGRYKQKVDELAGRMREIQAAGTALVAELGEDPHDRAGQLMVNAMTTAYTHLVLDSNSEDRKLSIKEAAELARGARAVMETRKMSMAERQQIAQEAREALQREQREKLEELRKTGAIDQATFDAASKITIYLPANDR